VRILHVVTVITEDNAYGGPVTVARNLSAALRLRGHEAVLLAGRRGSPPSRDGERTVGVRPWLPRSRFSGLFSARYLRTAVAEVRRADVVHVHLARDLVPLAAGAAAILLRRPLVVQTHGMITPDSRLRARMLDRWLTRPILGKARAVLVLTDVERSAVTQVCPAATVSVLPNGVPPSPHRAQPPVAAPRTVFLARLHERKRVEDFIALAQHAARRHPDAEFVIAGPDDGQLDIVRSAIADPGTSNLTYAGTVPPEDVPAFLAGFHLLALPSYAEPFPMSALEAWSVGVPVIVREDNGLATAVRRHGAGSTFDGDWRSLYEAWRRLAADPSAWRTASNSAQALADGQFAVDQVGTTLQSIYQQARAAHPPVVAAEAGSIDPGEEPRRPRPGGRHRSGNTPGPHLPHPRRGER
jgi:glycosyltransferase involved in cell wall biosynthesis